MKDLTKGKPSTLILSFALPVFLGNLLQLTYSLADTRIVGSFLKEDALAAVGGHQSFKRADHRFSDGPCKWICHCHRTEIRCRKPGRSTKILCAVSCNGQRDFSDPDCFGTFVSASDPEVPECSGSFDGNCQAVYLYYYRRYAGNVSL